MPLVEGRTMSMIMTAATGKSANAAAATVGAGATAQATHG
jgi:hypothetical protein